MAFVGLTAIISDLDRKLADQYDLIHRVTHPSKPDLYNILMKLRDEHRYCLYCGCQYESMEALRTDCPGLYEDDH